MRVAFLLLLFSGGLALAQQSGQDASLLTSAVRAQQGGDFATAIRDYKKILKIHPEAAEVRANLGAALTHEHQFDDAIAQYRLALASLPDNDAIHLNLGLAYFKEGDFQDAQSEFQRDRKTQPRNVRLAILLGDCELRLGHAVDATVMLAPMESENAKNTDFEYVLGTALIQAGKRRDGVTRIERVAHATNSADAYLLAGSTLISLNEFKGARVDLEESLRLNPQLPGVLTLVGMARDLDGDPTNAEPILREVLQRDPNDFDANLYLGAILYKRRDMENAKIYLDRATTLKPSNPTAGYEMAMWYSSSGQYAKAAKLLEALVKSNPDWLQPHIELANVYYRLHRPEDGAKERTIVAKLSARQQSEGPPKIQQP